MAGRIAGIVYLRKNDKLLTLGDGEITCNEGETKKETVMSSSGSAGYKETPQFPFVEGDLIYTRDLDIRELKQTSDSTVTVDFANGKTFVLINAFWASPGDVSSSGIIKMRFEGMKGAFVNNDNG